MKKPFKKNNPGLAARQAATETVWRVLIDETYLDEAFEIAIGAHRLEGRDRALVRAISATTLRRLGQIKAVLAKFMKKPLSRKFSHGSCVLYTGVAQILFMKVPDHSAIDLAVSQLQKQSKLHHLSGMANAVLRKVANENQKPDQDNLELRVGRENTPKWLWQLWAKDFGKPVADKIANAHLCEAALDISLRGDECQLEADDLPMGMKRLPAVTGKIEELPGYGQGEWWVQDFAASLPASLFGDINGKVIADLCAAPGGKTMQLARDGAKVLAVDISKDRLLRVEQNLERVGLSAQTICSDVLEWTPEDLLDGVLLDAPCSATGTIRRHPDALYLKKSSDIDTLSKLQSQLLKKAANLVKPDGILIYCTCSLQKREGELQISKFLAENDQFERVGISAREIGGLSHLIDENGDVRTLPFYKVGESTGMDGFFIARLKRKSP